MVDHEVAEILAEIKRRVSAADEKPLAQSAVVDNSPRANSPLTTATNDFPGLTVMARAWDRLPPIVSNRRGTPARFELWVKEKFRAAFRWFTWEQVNFNSATYQTFRELVAALAVYEQHLSQIKQNLDAEREELKRLSSTLPTHIEQVDRQHLAMIAQINARLEGVSQLAKDQQAETRARLAELMSESRARNEQLTDEQRVCYKQLSLEISESRVLEDRARRELDARVTKLEHEA